MKVTAFVGSARKKHTYKATETFLKKLQSFGNIEYELIALSDYKIETCKGCITCFNKGEEFCPFKDDRDFLIQKMEESDGVIFASPNYSFHVSGIMKVFLDRLGFIFHRPRFFGKTFTSIVVQGIYGGNKIVNYFNFIGPALGFNRVKGSCLKSLEPMTEKTIKKNGQILEKHAKRFYKQLLKEKYPTPNLFEVMIFRISRSSIKSKLDENYRDFNYFDETGWFDAEFYYPVKLNFMKRLFGRLIDRVVIKLNS